MTVSAWEDFGVRGDALFADAKLTELERRALNAPFNLADGHARTATPLTEEMFGWALGVLRGDVSHQGAEDRFLESFGATIGQSLLRTDTYCVLAPTASVSLEVVANVLRLRGMSLLAPVPCFDNLIDIMHRHGVPLVGYDAEGAAIDQVMAAIRCSTAGAVLIVAPGNPAGQIADRSGLCEIFNACATQTRLLVIDASFRIFASQLCAMDMYDELIQRNLRFLAIEDMGKFVQTFDMKVSPLIADMDSAPLVRDVYDDMFLSASPLSLVVLGELFAQLGPRLVHEARSIVDKNRAVLEATVEGYLDAAGSPSTSVSWLKPREPQPLRALIRSLWSAGIHVLPGERFYWRDKETVADFRLRVALLREIPYFQRAMDLWAEVLGPA